MLVYKPCLNALVIVKQSLFILCLIATAFFILYYNLFGYSLIKRVCVCVHLCVFLCFSGSVVMQFFGKMGISSLLVINSPTA